MLALQCWIEKLITFPGLEGGAGVLPWKILKTKKAGEAISGHFVGPILPSLNEEFQRMLLPFISYALFK